MKASATTIKERAPGSTGIVAIWAILPAIPALAVFTSRVWGTGPFSSLWAILMTVSGALAVRGIWEVTRSRPDLVRWAVASIALIYAWLMVATFAPNTSTGRPIGPLSWLLGVWVLLAVPLCLVLTVRILPSVRGADGSGSDPLDGIVTSLKDAKLGRPQVNGPRVSADITLPPGGDIAAVQKEQRGIASVLDVNATQVRIAPTPNGSPRRGRIDVVVADQLGKGVPWLPLTSPGGPVSDPITLGRYEDGQPARLWLVGDDQAGRNAAGIIAVVAMKGAGKTTLMRRFVSEYLSRERAERNFWLADPRKFGQLPKWVREAADRTAATEAACVGMLDDVMLEASLRAQLLGDKGHEQWQDGCGLPFLLVWIDEAAGLGDGAERLIDIAETVRSTGICVVVAYQRFTGDRVPTSAREQISTVVCMGVKGQAEGARVLSAYTIDAGADPSVWADRNQGMAYLEAAGVEEERWPVPWRVCRGEDAAIEAELAPYLSGERTSGAPSAELADEQAEADDQDRNGEEETMSPEEDPRVPIPQRTPPPAMRFIDPLEARPDAERAAMMVRQRAEALAGACEDGQLIAPADFGDVLIAAQRSPGWLTGQLKDLSTPGPGQVLVRLESKGRYAPAHREPALTGHGA